LIDVGVEVFARAAGLRFASKSGSCATRAAPSLGLSVTAEDVGVDQDTNAAIASSGEGASKSSATLACRLSTPKRIVRAGGRRFAHCYNPSLATRRQKVPP
jgi:hypothetical protein